MSGLSFINVAYGSGAVTVPERLFKMTGAEVNTTEGDFLYESQAAGYYTGGGGMVVRSPVKSTQLMNIQLPQIDAGCGGIDIYTGGFSFINKQQLVETLQTVASNSAGFAFMLGLESVSPSIANTMRQLQSWANTMNGIGINSCEVGAALVGSVWPANDIASQHICRAAGPKLNHMDFLESRHHCSNRDDVQMKNLTKENSFMQGEYNITWEALMLQPYFRDEKHYELAELYMTLVGTFIVKDNEQPQFYFSKVDDGDFLKCLLEGGTIKKYSCEDKKKCLVLKETDEKILLKDSWFERIRTTLASMQEKAKNDQPLDTIEKGLLSTSRLPLYKFINVLSAYHRGKPCPLDVDQLADIVTWDVLVQTIHEAIETVRRGCLLLRDSSMYSTQIDRCLKDLEHVRESVQRYEVHLQKGIDLEMRLIKKMQMLENQLNSEIMVN